MAAPRSKARTARATTTTSTAPKKATVKKPVVHPLDVPTTAEFDKFIGKLNQRFQTITEGGNVPLFTTDLPELFTAYLDAIPAADRQYHTCNTCRRFIDKFGTLAVIGDDGRPYSPFWDPNLAPAYYKPAMEVLALLVHRANITGVFKASEEEWGTRVTGEWRHFAIAPSAAQIHKDRLKTAYQSTAEKLEDYKNVARALDEFPLPILTQAVQLLKSEALYRSEKVLGPAEWLFNLQETKVQTAAREWPNVLWLAIAKAPAGFCHPRSSMIGTLLEDLVAGLSFEVVKRRFAEKMAPLQYMRPQAAPTAQNIKRGEEIIEKLGLTSALARRFARLEDLETLWTPDVPKPAKAGKGIFGHLKPKNDPFAPFSGGSQGTPVKTMTWVKFLVTVLPEAQVIEYWTTGKNDNYTALLTAVDPDAGPLLQWDDASNRNPVSWYVWNGGSSPRSWGLADRSWVRVNAITYKPSMWHGGFEHQGEGAIFILDGAKETRTNTGLGLFPEILKAELHECRATIEAFSRSGKLEGADEASANGILLNKGNPWDHTFRVKTKLGEQVYKLDRWD